MTGGEVRLWASGTTRFTGSIAAAGGAVGGDGGFVEVSGGALRFQGRVDAGAPRGRRGQVLLDPVNLSIDAAAASAIVTGLASADYTAQATSTLSVDAAISSTSNRTLILDAPTIAINQDVSLANGVLQLASSSGAGVSLTSGSGVSVTAHQVNVFGNFASADLAGPVVGSSVVLDESTGAFSAANASNRIDKLELVGMDASSLSGDVEVSSSTAMQVTGGALGTSGALTLKSGGDLTLQSGVTLSSGGTMILASTGGAFVNDAGSSALSGVGRRRIYTRSQSPPYDDGGLGYTVVTHVNFPDDPNSGLANVIYAGFTLPLLTITANDFSRLYGQPDPGFTVSYSGGSASDLTTPVGFKILEGAHANVGTYTIVPYGAGSATHELSYVNGILTVTRAPLAITAVDASRLYGAANPGFSASYSGLVNGDTSAVVSGLSLSTPATAASGVGIYPITPSGASAANYAISYVPGTLTVGKAQLTITAKDAARLYGDPNPAFEATFTGLVNGDDASVVTGLGLSTAAAASSDVGTYAITPSGASAGNYAIAYENGALRVTPAPLTVTADDAQIAVGTALPAFSASYSGFRNGDGPGLLDVTFDVDSAAARNAGTYIIHPMAQLSGAPNYDLDLVDGTLFVAAPPPPIKVSSNAPSTFSSGLQVLVGPVSPGLVDNSAAFNMTVLSLGPEYAAKLAELCPGCGVKTDVDVSGPAIQVGPYGEVTVQHQGPQ